MAYRESIKVIALATWAVVLTYLSADQQSYWYERAAAAKARESAWEAAAAEAESERRRAERLRCWRQLRDAVARLGLEEEEGRRDWEMDVAAGRREEAAEREARMMSAGEGEGGREGEGERMGRQEEGKRAARQARERDKGGIFTGDERGKRRRRRRREDREMIVMERRRKGSRGLKGLLRRIEFVVFVGFMKRRKKVGFWERMRRIYAKIQRRPSGSRG